MLNDITEITSPDFPELVVSIRRPGPKDWAELQEEMIRGNTQEAYLNLFIAIGKVTTTDGSTAPLLSALADEWSNLTETVMGMATMMAGGWGGDIGNAHRLDLAAILAAAERVAAAQAQASNGDAVSAALDSDQGEIALARLAEQCAVYGFGADLMRTTLACHPRRGAFRAYLIDDIGAFVFTRPGTSARSAWDRRGAGNHAEACSRLVTTCTAFPPAGELLALASRLPAFVTAAAGEIQEMRGDIAVEVKKGSTASRPPPETPSARPPA